jgi:hypothetical protein
MNSANEYTNISIDNELELLPLTNIQPISDLFNSDGTFGWSNFLLQELINSQMHEEEVSRLLNGSGNFDFSDFPCQAEHDNIKFQAKEVETMKPTPNLLLIPPSPTTVCATISKEVRFEEEDAVMTMDIPKTTRRSVRFASEVSVRTHSVMVGDHPCCMDGMAIELGWESRDGTATLRQHRKCKKEAPRLSYAQRVQRLHMVTSLTYRQLWLEEYLLKLSLDNVTFAMTLKEERYIHPTSKMEECKSNESVQLMDQLAPPRRSSPKVYSRPCYNKEQHPLVVFQAEG